ncbi:uncharacterized protein [Aegilops tauschii subsp. strangulata]|uniref:uncharacterized protein n=1 Tax=Aegilops tauschii subsp. strangulata TaxID=200361 RepID=UPI003CC87D9A
MWIIWSSRNKYTHEEVKYQPGRSMVLVKELIQALYIPSEAVDRRSLEKEKWKPSEEGWCKINADASVDVNGGSSAIGLVVRDHGGELMLARGRKLLGVTDPYCAELLGVREAVCLAMEKGWTRVTVESDCKTIIDEYMATECRSTGSPIISEIKSYLQNFQGLRVNYVRREANEAAHWCARESLASASNVISFDVFPASLIALVQSDVNCLSNE